MVFQDGFSYLYSHNFRVLECYVIHSSIGEEHRSKNYYHAAGREAQTLWQLLQPNLELTSEPFLRE